MVSKAKEGQANLRRDYYQKKKPIASQMDELKTQIAGCNRKMKELEAKIKNIKEGTQDEIYTVQMKKLKQQLVQLKQERDASLAQLESDTTQKISAITEITDRRLKRKEIISQAQDARVQIWQTYNSKKEEIDKLIHTAKKEHNQRMEEAAWQKAQERKLEAEKEKSETKAQNISVEKGPTCNFEHR
jgi:superfamily II RNA helicase